MDVVSLQKAVVEEFSALQAWEDRYKHIIELGKKLPAIDETHKVEKNLVRGCQSQVWLCAELNNGKVVLCGDSDAMIVRGLVSILLRVYSGQTPDDILSYPPDFLKKLGFDQQLSPSRANGLFSMVKQIRLFAAAYQMITRSQS